MLKARAKNVGVKTRIDASAAHRRITTAGQWDPSLQPYTGVKINVFTEHLKVLITEEMQWPMEANRINERKRCSLSVVMVPNGLESLSADRHRTGADDLDLDKYKNKNHIQ